MDLRGVVTLMKEHERHLGLTESEILPEVSAFVEMILQQGRGVDTSSGSDGSDNVSIATSTGPAPDSNSSTLNFNKTKTVTEGFLCPSCRRRLRDEVRFLCVQCNNLYRTLESCCVSHQLFFFCSEPLVSPHPIRET